MRGWECRKSPPGKCRLLRYESFTIKIETQGERALGSILTDKLLREHFTVRTAINDPDSNMSEIGV